MRSDIRNFSLAVVIAAACAEFLPIAVSAQTVGAWDGRAAVSASVNSAGNQLAYPAGGGDAIYQRRGDDNTFNKYSISGNSWSALASDNCGASVGAGTFLVAGDSGFLYASCPGGTPNFVRYSISGNNWINTLTTSPAGFGTGASAVWDGSGHIYALAGGSTISFSRYNISADTWSPLANTPAGIGGGGALAYPGSGDFIYALRGASTKTFYRYSISGDSWTAFTPATTPDTVGGGAALVAPDTSTIYALRGDDSGGGPTTAFWSYSIAGDSWTSLTAAPAAVGSGGSLAYISNSSGTFLYELRGAGTTDFNRYTISLSGGSSGSLLIGPAALQTGLRHATPPASPTNIVVAQGQGMDASNVSVTFANKNLLSIDLGQPINFILRADNNSVPLASIAESSADTTKQYTMTLSGLPQNTQVTDWKLCASRNLNEGCASISTFWTSWNPAVTVVTAAEGGAYRMTATLAPYPNQSVGSSGAAMTLSRIEPAASAVPVPTSFLALAMDSIRAAFSGTLAQNGTTAASNNKTLVEKTFIKSGTWSVVNLAPGIYELAVAPVSGNGSIGDAAYQTFNLKPMGDPIELSLTPSVVGDTLATNVSAKFNRSGNNSVDIVIDRGGGAQDDPTRGAPIVVRFSLAATVAPPRTTTAQTQGAETTKREQFEFVFSCPSGGAASAGACDAQQTSAQQGNVTNNDASVGRDGVVTIKTPDAIVSVRMSANAAHATVSAIGGELRGVEATLNLLQSGLLGGEGSVHVKASDALGNNAEQTASVALPAKILTIEKFEVVPASEARYAGENEARAVITHLNLSERRLFLNLAVSGEELNLGGGVPPITANALELTAFHADGTGVQLALDCASACSTKAVTIPEGTAIAVTRETNSDGTVRDNADGITIAFNPQIAFPLLLGATGTKGIDRIELRARYALGLGNYTAALTANEAQSTVAFFGSGTSFALFPGEIKVLFDLFPIVIQYFAPQTPAPVINSVSGGRVEEQPGTVQALNAASNGGAPVSPLLNAVLKFFGAGQ